VRTIPGGSVRLLGNAEADDFEAESTAEKVAQALVLPDQDWYRAAEAYVKFFGRILVVRPDSNLNRYRNVTVVQAPGVWPNDNALAYIRHTYRNVVRVDTIPAKTPTRLQKVLQQRISQNDRYGAKQNGDGHIDVRFVVHWPVDSLPARIVIPFDDDIGNGQRSEGVVIDTPAGTLVRASIAGTVAAVARQATALGYGQYVQIGTIHQGKHYLVTLAHLKDITVSSGQAVKAGDVIGSAEGSRIKLVVQSPGRGLDGYRLPHVIDPTELIYWNSLRLRAIDNGLRVRTGPSTAFDIVTVVNANDDLETLELHGRALVKAERESQWINVRTPDGRSGYSAGWFLQAVAPELIDQRRLTGVNIDRDHPLGRPKPDRLGGMGWVRFVYNVSYNPQTKTYGNTDLALTQARYKAFIEQYAHAGYKVMMVFTHQTYGEGAGFNWNQMDDHQWLALTVRFAEMVREIAGQYGDLIDAYQIWNEQDAPPGANSSVPMLPGDYAFLLGESIRAIRSADRETKIITGGHVSGPGAGVEYARSVLRALPPGIVPDGIAFHPYGRGVSASPYAPFGHIDETIERFGKLLPDKRLWITEWGVLDHPTDAPKAVAQYAGEVVRRVRIRYPGRVAALLWYAWAQGMHNGYGLVGGDDQPRQPLYGEFIRL
jgi:hypothetical protein